MIYLGESNGNLSETKKCYLFPTFLKMRKFLLDTRKDFLIMSNFYLVEILSEPSNLTIVTSKKILKMSNYVLILITFFLKMRIRNLQCTYLISTKSLQIASRGRSSRSQMFFQGLKVCNFIEKSHRCFQHRCFL